MPPEIKLDRLRDHWLVGVLQWVCVGGVAAVFGLVVATAIHQCTEPPNDARNWRILAQTVEDEAQGLRVDFGAHSPYLKATIRHDRLPFRNVYLLFDVEGKFVGSGTVLLEDELFGNYTPEESDELFSAPKVP